MIFTIEFINDRFDRFNKQMFKGRLPRIPVKLSKSKTSLGMFCTKYQNKPDGSRIVVDKHFSFSTKFDLEEQKLEDVIIHEMIHYLISFENFKDTSPHGIGFRSVMDKINREFNRNITISTRTSSEDKVSDSRTDSKWHIIAVIKLTDGSVGIKVLPRYADKVIYYSVNALDSPKIKALRLFLHKSIFFNRYPTSSALKFHSVNEEILRNELKGAQIIYIEDKRLKRSGIYKGENLF